MPTTKVIKPAKRSLAGVLAKFAKFSPDFMSGAAVSTDKKSARPHRLTP
jgi:hypothetical protein